MQRKRRAETSRGEGRVSIRMQRKGNGDPEDRDIREGTVTQRKRSGGPEKREDQDPEINREGQKLREGLGIEIRGRERQGREEGQSHIGIKSQKSARQR